MLINLNGKDIAVTVVKKTGRDDLYEYYIGDTKIGVLDTDVMEDNILMLQNTLGNELSNQIKDAIDRLPREEVEQEGKLSREIDTYMKEFGKRDEVAKGVTLVDLDESTNEEEKEEIEGKIEEDNNKGEKEDKEDEDKTSTIEDVNVKQSVELDERANDMHDVRKWMGLPQDIDRIGVIESYQMSDLKNAKGENYDKGYTRYSLVAIGKDGKVRPLSKYIPDLEQRGSVGNDPTKESYQVDTEGRVEKDAVLSEYQFGNKIIQIDNREMGRIEINIGEEARDSTEVMGVQLRAENTTFATDTSTRSVIGEYEANGEDTVEMNIEEAKKHPDPENDKMDERDVDGDPNTKSHVHVEDKVYLEDGTELTFDELATRWGFYKDDGKPDGEYAREKYLEKQMEDLEKEPQEIVEELDEDFEDPRIQNQRGE